MQHFIFIVITIHLPTAFLNTIKVLQFWPLLHIMLKYYYKLRQLSYKFGQKPIKQYGKKLLQIKAPLL